MKHPERGVTLAELAVSLAILGAAVAAFSGLLRYSMKATVTESAAGTAQEGVRQSLMKLEEALVHANAVRVASSTFVEFTVDLDQRTDYSADADADGDGVPDYRDGDRDGDAYAIVAASAQWRVGFNLKDDDEDGDGAVDLRRRLYLSGRDLLLDASVNEDAWGQRVQRLETDVSTFTLRYFGAKANDLGKFVDLGNDGISGTGDSGENDGIVSAREIDWVQSPAGMGDRSGTLDSDNERRYLTTIRLTLGADANKDGKTDYSVETDVYPPLLPLKAR